MSRLFTSLQEAAGAFGPCALTIGNFDGVHLGHRTLIRQTQQIARTHGWITGVLTFHPHPTSVVAPDRAPKLICSVEERITLLEKAGAEHVLVLPFTRQVAEMNPREFVTTVLDETLNAHAVVVGQNFRFGYKQLGDTSTLAQLGAELAFEPHFLAPITSRGEVVSSTAIRRHLQQGNVSRAGRLLGRCFSVSGDIVSGRGIGSRKTVPTLNILPTVGILPQKGIYITETQDLADQRHWHSVTSVGTNPTFGGGDLTIETYLLSPFDGRDPKTICVSFRRWLREEQTFPTAEALRDEILRDVARAETYWRRIKCSVESYRTGRSLLNRPD
jgi:riboflavin kinase / FMN adenylyltransferase